MPPESLSLVERYGSFGLVCVVVVSGGWFIRWLVREFLAELKAERAARAEQHERCEDAHRQTADVLAGLAAQVQRLADRTDEHRPLKRG